MTIETSNDGDGSSVETPGPDRHGQAALLLVESLIHGLIAREALTVTDAVEIVETAAEVEREMAVERAAGAGATGTSLTLIGAIGDSLKRDLPQD